MEHVSPRIRPDHHANTAQGGFQFQSNRAVPGSIDMPEVGARKVDGYEKNVVPDPSQGGYMLFFICIGTKSVFLLFPPCN